MALSPLTFDPPYQTQPIARLCSRSGMQHPINRNRYYILKYASSNGLYLQIREPVLGWQTERQIFDRPCLIYSSPVMCFNSVGDLMILFFGLDEALVSTFVYAYFLSADETVTSTTALSLPSGVVSAMQAMSVLGLTCKSALNFAVAWAELDAGSNGHMITNEFDGLTRTWGTKVDVGRPGGIGGFNGIIIRQHPKDGSLRYGCLVRGTGFATDLYYYDDRQPGVWTLVYHEPTANFDQYEIDMELDPRYEERVHIVSERRRLADPRDIFLEYWQRDIGGLWSITAEQLAIGTVTSASSPSLECDSNGDLYFVWKEWDAAASRMAVYAKRRIDSDNVWEPPVKVANSILWNVNDPDQDPGYPGIVRTPCSDYRIGDFCVTWGDAPTNPGSDLFSYVYISCSFVRSLSPAVDLSVLYALNACYKDDLLIAEPGQGSWSKWKGPGTRPLNCIRFLTLDQQVDGGILIYATADATGAWVNQLKVGNIDVDAPYEFRWTTKKLADPSPQVPKIWRYVKLRAVGVVDPVTFTWRTDGGRATGTFVVYQDGWHEIPLPASCQGRVFDLMLVLMSDDTSPEFHDVQVQGAPKRQAWGRRPISA